MSLEQKYLKYKNKYLDLKKKNSSNQAFNNMRGGVIYKQLTYERVDIDLPETFDIGELIVFVGKLSYKGRPVGTSVIKYFIVDNLEMKGGNAENTRPVSRSLESALASSAQPPLPQARDESSQGSVVSAPSESSIVVRQPELAVVSSSPTHIVKIALTIVLFDGTMYNFSNENVPISLRAAANRTLAPYEVNAILDLKRNNNNEKDIKLEYSIKDGKGKFTINPSGSIF